LKVIGIGVNWRRAAAAAAFALSLGLCALAGQVQTPVSAQVDPAELLCRNTLTSFGWEVSALVSQEQVRLPTDFDASYQEFLRLQKEAGFPLASYAGRTVTRYTYRIENYPTGEANMFADLFVIQQQVIGGDIRTASLNGFMTSLVRPDRSMERKG
jgi:hypothetical protein